MPQNPETHGNEWFAEQVDALPHRWDKGNQPRGTVRLQSCWTRLKRTQKMKPRICLEGYDLHVRDMPGLAPHEEFEGDYLMEVIRGKKNHSGHNANFSTHIRDVNFQLGYRCSGLWFGGAQCSSIYNIRVSAPKRDKGVCAYIGRESSRLSLELLDLIGDPVWGGRNGTGLIIERSHGIVGQNIHTHRLAIGLDIQASHSATIIGNVAEKSAQPLRIQNGSSGISVIGFDWQRTGDTPIDLRRRGPAIRIQGRIRKSPDELFYISRRGKRKSLGTGFSDNDGRCIDLRF